MRNSILFSLALAIVLPKFTLGQAEKLILSSSLEADSIFTKNGNWLLYTIEESYVDAGLLNDETGEAEMVIYSRSASIIFEIGKKSPLLIESTLLAEDDSLSVLQRIIKKVKTVPNPYPDTLEFGEETEYVLIHHLEHGLFSIDKSHYEYYPGAAHGFGTTTVTYFDAAKDAYVDFGDVFTEDIYPFLHQKLKQSIREEFPDWEINDAEVDTIAAEGYAIDNGQYLFEKDGLTIQCQMYDTLFGWMYTGYNYFSFTLGWEELMPYLKKPSPIKMLLE